MLRLVVIILIVIIAAVLILATRKPNRFVVTRAALIDANVTELFPYINDLRAFRQWSPWEGKDPSMKATHSGEDHGPGSIYEWDGDRKVGQGRMEILTSELNRQVVIKIDFIRPFDAHNTVEFLLSPELNKTRFEWKIHGPNAFMSKVMQVFVSMDKMIGSDFEQGLENLQALVEQQKNLPPP